MFCYISSSFFFTTEVTFLPTPPPSSRRGGRDAQSFATWRPTASLLQPIGGCGKQPPAPPLVQRSREPTPPSKAESLCRLALPKPIIPPSPPLSWSLFSNKLSLYGSSETHTDRHTHTNLSPPQNVRRGVWESGGHETHNNETLVET